MRIIKFFSNRSLGLSALLLLLSQTSAQSFTLDAFTSFDATQNPDDSQTVSIRRNSTAGAEDKLEHNNLDPATLFGDRRTIKITKNDSDRGAILLDLFDGEAFYESGSRVHGTSEIIWDGHEDAGTWVDIEADDQNSIELTISSLIVGNEVDSDGIIDFNFHFEIRDTSNNFVTITRTLTSNVITPSPIYFLYQDRVEDPDNTANTELDKIDYIRFYTSDENEGADYTFDLVQTANIPFEFSPKLGIIVIGSFWFLDFLRRKIIKSNINKLCS